MTTTCLMGECPGTNLPASGGGGVDASWSSPLGASIVPPSLPALGGGGAEPSVSSPTLLVFPLPPHAMGAVRATANATRTIEEGRIMGGNSVDVEFSRKR